MSQHDTATSESSIEQPTITLDMPAEDAATIEAILQEADTESVLGGGFTINTIQRRDDPAIVLHMGVDESAGVEEILGDAGIRTEIICRESTQINR